MKRLILCAALTGCVTPNETYVNADEATYNVIAPRYQAYVKADPALEPLEQAREMRLLDSWKLRITKAKEALAR